jgi:hypothetical protein
MIYFQVFSEHLKLTSDHLYRHFQQPSMDGSKPVLLNVCTREKSPITQLTVRRVQKLFAQRCHGGLF